MKILDRLIAPTETLRKMIETEHERMESAQKSPWIGDAESRYRSAQLPNDVRGEENQEAWNHIQRHLALMYDGLRETMLPPHWLPQLRTEGSQSFKIKRSQPSLPRGAVLFRGIMGKDLYRIRNPQGVLEYREIKSRALVMTAQNVVVDGKYRTVIYRDPQGRTIGNPRA